MGTNIRPELSKKNQYRLEKERYYELKHFCMQYTKWKHDYSCMSATCRYAGIRKNEPGKGYSSPTETIAVERASLYEKIMMIERAAEEADKCLAFYILLSVTEGFTYPQLKSRYSIPCGKDMFYDRYHKFFWILDKKRN